MTANAEPKKLRAVDYADEDACIADVRRLREGWRNGGAWSLAQACWHLEVPVSYSMRPPATIELTPQQQKFHAFLERTIESGWPSSGGNAPAEMVPPADAGPEAIDAYIAALGRLQAYDEPYVDAFLFGPVATAKFRRFMLAHAAHHLSFFEPAAGG